MKTSTSVLLHTVQGKMEDMRISPGYREFLISSRVREGMGGGVPREGLAPRDSSAHFYSLSSQLSQCNSLDYSVQSGRWSVTSIDMMEIAKKENKRRLQTFEFDSAGSLGYSVVQRLNL